MRQSTSLAMKEVTNARALAVAAKPKPIADMEQVEWTFADEMPDVATQDSDWDCYSVGLVNDRYGRSLSEIEEQYERSCWVRARLMMRNLDAFDALVDVAHSFVEDLTREGGQRLLGVRANLAHLKRSAQPSDWVQFGPAYPPSQPPLGVSDYERLVGGPHILGARLIWWCAGAKKPKNFGFSCRFPQLLAAQPIWVTTCGQGVSASQYPLQLMQETATDIVRLLTSDSSLEASKTDDEPIAQGDGPCEVNTFRYRDSFCSLTETSWQLLSFLWHKRQRRAYCDDAIDDLWGGDVSKAAVETAACRINKIFRQNNIPFRVRVKSKFVFVENEGA
jgi:hypothetical protein